MKSKALAIAALLLVACEGEPPKVPEVPASVAQGEPVAAAAPVTEEPTTEPAAATTPATTAALPPCACNCGCNGVPAGDGGAPAAAPAAAAPVAAVHSISGDLASTPKGAAANAVVYIEDAPVEHTAKMTTTITNHMMTFSPYIAVVPVGGKVVFRNEDPFPHNVFSPDNEKFNMGMIPQLTAAVRVFKKPGSYTLLCNVHPGMLGYLVVSPSSYYGKADAHGHFTIKNVPPGTYKVTAWAPRLPPVTQPVTVKDGDVSINFELHR